MPREDFEQRQIDRRERLERAAEKARARSAAAYKRADLREEVSGIPFGQPILVGHHSERRHRRAIERADNAMRQSIAEDRKADRYERSIAAMDDNRAISSDDPDALDKLREKLASMEARQEKWKAINADWRKAGNKAGRQTDGTWLEPPVAPYQLSNASANMKRVRERIKRLEREFQRETVETQTNVGVRMVQNADINRVQLIFDGKPDFETRKELKSRGFRWAPSEGAWQRMLNNSGIWAGQQVIKWITDQAE